MWPLVYTLQPSLSLPKGVERERSFPSPIAGLPPEILSYVFRLYLLPLEEQTHISSLSAQSPSSLAQVCRIWSTIVQSDPHLWTSIRFYFLKDARKRTDEDNQKIPPILDLHLKHSGTLPLSFTFIDLRAITPSTDTLAHLLLARLREHSRRWKRILLHSSPGYITFLLDFTRCDLPSLEYLHIHNDLHLCSTHAPVLSLESAKNLKSFTSSGFYCLYITTTNNLFWGRLVEVSFDFAPSGGHTFAYFRRYSNLRYCQNLVTCSLGIPDEPGSHQMVLLPRLQTLRVRRLEKKARTCILHLLILPQLKTLEIDSRLIAGSHPSFDDHLFSELLARSGCALQHLSIQDIDLPNEELVRCLALSPSLKSLCFVPYPRSQDIGDVIRKLDVSFATTVQGDQQRHGHTGVGTHFLVPQLREITLGTSRKADLDPMMAMLRSRGGTRARTVGVASLQRVEVMFFRKPWIRVMFRPRGWLKKLNGFRENLGRWASEVETESENGVVTKVRLRQGKRERISSL